jgi:hypothetical protein
MAEMSMNKNTLVVGPIQRPGHLLEQSTRILFCDRQRTQNEKCETGQSARQPIH